MRGDLRLDEGHAHGVVADDRAQLATVLAQLEQQRLHQLIAHDQIVAARAVDDVRRPDQWHPVLCHWTAAVHHLHDLLFALHHYTWNRTAKTECNFSRKA